MALRTTLVGSLTAALVALAAPSVNAQGTAPPAPPAPPGDAVAPPASEAAGSGSAADSDDATTGDDAASDAAKPDDGAASTETAAKPDDGSTPTEGTASAEAAGDEARIEDIKQRIAALEKAKEEAEIAALTEGGDAEAEAERDPLRIYGFFDVGAGRVSVNERSAIANFIPGSNSLSFVIGNLNLYFDAQPVPDWRGLLEVRFTNAPHGLVESPGGFGSEFSRVSTQQIDPHATAANAPMWGGRTVIERAWIEWNHWQFLKVRVGNFFTPWGIWNIDHGTPTLISLGLPQFILQQTIPIRQTGIQVHGNTFAGDWELAYHATLTNGRQEISNFDFDDDKGFGARLVARYQTDGFRAAFGGSGFIGNFEDETVEITAVDPLTFEKRTAWKADEMVGGLDVSLDIGAGTRLRWEGVARRLEYDENARRPADPLFTQGDFNADSFQYHTYLIAAQRLPWAGLEPYFFGQVQYTPSVTGDLVVGPGGGLNVYFTPQTQLKVFGSYTWFFLGPDSLDVSLNEVSSVQTRLVMAF